MVDCCECGNEPPSSIQRRECSLFPPGRTKDLSALLYQYESRIVDGIGCFVTATFQLRNVLSLHFVCLSYALSAQNVYIGSRQQWLRCCATNRKVAGSIPAGVTGIFH